MSPLLAAGLTAFVALCIFVPIAGRMSNLHRQLSDAYRLISKMLIANENGKPDEVQQLADDHANCYGFKS